MFYFLRRQAFRLRHQCDSRPIEVRKHVNWNERETDQAVNDKHQRRRKNEQTVSQAVGDEETEHRQTSYYRI